VCWTDVLPEEMQELIILETAVAKWRNTHNTDISHVLLSLGNVCHRWERIVEGQVFKDQLAARLELLLRAGNYTYLLTHQSNIDFMSQVN